MNSHHVIFKVHEACKCQLHTFIVEKWAVLTWLKLMMSVKVTLQQMFAAEDMLLFEQRQCGVADAVQTLKRLTLKKKLMFNRCVKIQAFWFDFYISKII